MAVWENECFGSKGKHRWKGPKAQDILLSFQNFASVAEREQSKGRMVGDKIRQPNKEPYCSIVDLWKNLGFQ